MSSTRGKRIERNCKIIWGAHCAYDFDVETDDWVKYVCILKKDFGSSIGSPLTMTGLCPSEEAAWDELDRMLKLWADSVVRATPMSKHEKLNIFGGRSGEGKKI
jgi:hypothetical protein